jgi:hypothetical protein
VRHRSVEGPIHKAILQFLRTAFPPPCLVHHSANETSLKGSTVAIEIAKAKNNGMMPGWPDLEVVHPGGVFFLEVKAPNGRLSEPQRDIAEKMIALGHKWAVVRSIDDVVKALAIWGIQHRGRAQ